MCSEPRAWLVEDLGPGQMPNQFGTNNPGMGRVDDHVGRTIADEFHRSELALFAHDPRSAQDTPREASGVARTPGRDDRWRQPDTRVEIAQLPKRFADSAPDAGSTLRQGCAHGRVVGQGADRLTFALRSTWMGGRVVEGTGLENRHTGNGIVSSNLTPSVDI
jgi:hypothetical protein